MKSSAEKSEDLEEIQNQEALEGDHDLKKLNMPSLGGVLCRSIVMVSVTFINAAVLYASIMANINFSLIINLYSFTPFLNAISFYFIFKEKLNKMHIVGMVMILVCFLFTSLSEEIDFGDNKDKEPSKISIIVPIGLAIIATFFFNTQHVVSRYVTNKSTITSQ